MTAKTTKASKNRKPNYKQVAKQIAKDRRAEWEIVKNWLERQGRVAVLETDLKSFTK